MGGRCAAAAAADALPVSVTAIVWKEPHAMSRICFLLSAGIGVGVRRFWSSPNPSLPLKPDPHTRISYEPQMAIVCAKPHPTFSTARAPPASCSSATFLGVDSSVGSP